MLKRNRIEDRIAGVLLLLLGLIVVSPLVMLVASSLKPDRLQIMADMGSIEAFYVTNPTLDNFEAILFGSSAQNFGRYFINSVIILAGTITGTILIASMTAFTLLRGN